MKQISKKLILSVIIFSLVGLVLVIGENWMRAVFISILLGLWVFLSFKLQSCTLASFLLLVVVFPFNMCIQVPSVWGLYDPTVIGVWVNYLVPVIHLLDVVVALVLLSFFVENGSTIIIKFLYNYKIALGFMFSYFIIHNLIFHKLIVFSVTARVLLYALLGLIIFTIVRTWEFRDGVENTADWLIAIRSNLEDKFCFTWNTKNRYISYLLITLLISVLLQGILGYLQFNNGNSVGVNWLGESKVSVGGFGSSCVVLHGDLYLRASGTFAHPNILGGYLVVALIIFLTYGRKFWGKLILGVFPTVILFFTMSRTAWVLALVIWIVFLGGYLGKIIKRKKTVLRKVALKIKYINNISAKLSVGKKAIKNSKWQNRNRFWSISLLNGLVFERFRTLLDVDSKSWFQRLELIKISNLLVNWKTFFVGVGFGNFVYKLGTLAPMTESGTILFEPVHNIFILAFIENGLLAGLFLAYGTMLVTKNIIVNIWKIIFKSGSLIRLDDYKMTFLLFSTMFFWFGAGMVDHYLLTQPPGLLLTALFWGLQLGYVFRKKDNLIRQS